MTIEDAVKRAMHAEVSEIQPEGARCADWYQKSEPTELIMLYTIAYLLHELNVARGEVANG